jgi:hypothetical protein
MTLEYSGENTEKPIGPLLQPRSEAQASEIQHESADAAKTPNLDNAQNSAPQQLDSTVAFSAEPEPPKALLGLVGANNNDDQNSQCRPPLTKVET